MSLLYLLLESPVHIPWSLIYFKKLDNPLFTKNVIYTFLKLLSIFLKLYNTFKILILLCREFKLPLNPPRVNPFIPSGLGTYPHEAEITSCLLNILASSSLTREHCCLKYISEPPLQLAVAGWQVRVNDHKCVVWPGQSSSVGRGEPFSLPFCWLDGISYSSDSHLGPFPS